MLPKAAIIALRGLLVLSNLIYFTYTGIFASNFAVTKPYGFYFDHSERQNEFLTREKIASSNHKPQFKQIVFLRALSQSSQVGLSGSFDKIIFSVYLSCLQFKLIKS